MATWQRCAVLVIALCGFQAVYAATVTRGPYLQLGTDSSVVVRWRTDVATESQVHYGPAPGDLGPSVQSPVLTTEHELVISGLLPDTRYYYSVGTLTEVLAGDDADHFFETAPVVGTSKPLRIWVLGDSGTANADAMAVRDAYYLFTGSQHTSIWLMLGDNAYPQGTDSEYQAALFDIFTEMLRKSVLWPSIGNHDAVVSDSSSQTGPYFDMFNLPANGEAGGLMSGTEAYYSFDFANIHFVVLDSSGSDRTAGGAMMTWLDNDLALTNQPWIVAYWHHPPYSKGSHDSDNPVTDQELVDMRTVAVPILEDHGVDLVLSGHSHDYERSFLIDGHYGFSDTFGPEHVVDGGDGRVLGDGAYLKPLAAGVPHSGAVYTVAGSSGQITGGSLDHPVMFVSYNVLGSVVLDVDGDRLDATFLDWNGTELDDFTIIKDPELVADFSADPQAGPVPLTVDFTDLSVVDATQWAWDFDDDSVVDSTQKDPTHIYSEPGLHSVRLTVTSDQGVFEEFKQDYINASLIAPTAEFSGSPLIGVAPLSVDFTDLSQHLPSLWNWDFDDDGFTDSTLQHPSHIYTEPGIYSVELRVGNAAGQDEVLKSDYIVVIPDAPGVISRLVIGTDKWQISWDPDPEDCSYDVVRGDLMTLRSSDGDFGLSASQPAMGCLEENVTSPQTTDLDDPGPDEGFYYLVRGVSCSAEAGTYDTIGPSQLRSRDPQLQGPSSACTCDPSDDPDGDGFCSAFDNCPTVFNIDQEDLDGDAFGDACDCNATNPTCTTDCTDVDLDGFCVTSDCDDFDADTFPGAAPHNNPDACMKDSDDDDWGDEAPPPNVAPGSDCNDDDPAVNPDSAWYLDADGDGYGASGPILIQCEQPPGYALGNFDCDDTSPSTYPGAAPNDSASACMKDSDGDNWGDDDPPDGVIAGSDCDDNSSAATQIYPGAAPNDHPSACMKDSDGDDWGDETPPVGVDGGTDCDDSSGTAGQTFPGAAPDDDPGACMKDSDGDDWGDDAPPAGVTPGTDCDDTSDTAFTIFPGAAPNDDPGACMKDSDGDDWGDDAPPSGVLPGTDCDDDPNACGALCFPGNPLTEFCDTYDNDCDLEVDEDPTDCDDGQFCNGLETCDAGACQAASAVDCSAFDDQCNTGVCNEGTDACEAQAANEGNSCNDGLFCTTGESCSAGACDGGTAIDCSTFDDQCNTGVCNEGADACEASPINEGSSCDDGFACIENTTCTAGSCGGGSAVDCSGTGDQCNEDSTCDPGGSEGNCDTAGAFISGPCDDGNSCNIGEVCTSGVCGGGGAVDCSGTGDQCNADSTCDPGGSEGNCDTAGAFIAGSCDDGNSCNIGEVCTSGVCGGGGAVDCSGTGDQCNADSTCDPGGGEGNCDTAGAFITGSCDDGNSCNIGEVCTSGVCGGGGAVDCSGTGDQCNADSTCDPGGGEGNCDTAGAFITGSCDDGNSCNIGEVCTSGVCGGGGAVDCSGTGDQCNEDNTCDPGGAEGNCDTAGAFIAGPCDDDDACNIGEVCTSGVCGGGGAVDCSDTGDQCNADSTCDPGGAEGNCDTAGAFIAGSCDDGNSCNIGEVCTSGVCGGGGAVDCSGTGDQCNEDSTCDPGGSEGNCDTAGAFIAGSCDDGNACNIGEVCTSGSCGGGGAVDCSGTGDQCNEDSTCDPGGAEGNCDTAGAFITGSCNDGLACNSGEACSAGTCVGGSAVDCSGTGDQCNEDSTCDPAGLEDNCDTPGAFITGPCDDGLACNSGEACSAGSCVGGSAVDCSGTGDQCNEDSTCDPAGLEDNCDTPGAFITGPCDDGLACNVGEACSSGSCLGGAPTDCSGTGDQCNEDSTCDPAGLEDNCDTPGAFITGPCDDGLACNVGEACSSGSCLGGAPTDCSGTGDQCNEDSTCDPAGLEDNCDTPGAFITGPCDDGLACNSGEVCSAGSCVGGSAVDCSGTGDQCNEDSTCDPAGLEDNCDTAGAFITGPCDDGLACNSGEACSAGSCVGGSAVDCSGTGDQCNEDSTCDPAGLEDNCDTPGAFITGPCDDGLACNSGEACSAGSCVGGSAVDCSGTGDQCNEDRTCDPAGLEDNCDTAGAFITGPCDDGLACNSGEACSAGSCVGGSAVDCSGTGDQCNEDSTCDPGGAEGNCDTAGAFIVGSCDDGNSCNIGEVCTSGVCGGGGSVDCSGTGDQCNEDSTCDPGGAEGNCDTAGAFIAGSCDDGNACNTGEVCTSGVCGGGGAVDCSGTGDQCNEDSTCDPGGAEGNCDTAGAFITGSCDDGDACNIGEVCTSGSCGGGGAVDCFGTGDQCNEDSTCDPGGAEGNCDTAGAFITGACNDGNACNIGEICTSGVCGGGGSVDCSGTGDQCNEESTCDPGGAEGNCDTAGAFITGSCNDGLFCTSGETCFSGVCGGMVEENLAPDSELSSLALIGQTAGDCSTNDCVIDVDDDPDAPDDNWAVAVSDNSNTEMILSFPTPASLPGVGADLQEFRVQVRQTDPLHSREPQARIELWENGLLVRAGVDEFVVGTGQVVSFTWDAAELGTVDGSLVEIRVVGTKSGGSPAIRNALDIGAVKWIVVGASSGGVSATDCSSFDDQCHVGVCNESLDQCEASPKVDGASCDDSDACTTVDECQSGVCTGTTPVVCTALDQCHDVGVCNPGTGICTDPPKVDGASCDDSDACTTVDECQSGVCTGTTPVVCTALDQCHDVGVCNPGTGICTDPPKVDGASCDDSDACTTVDECQSGVCTGTTPVVCTALDQCHDVGVCNPGTGICTDPPKVDGASCDDSDACTTVDECQSGVCTGTTPVVCTALDQCHDVGVCNPGTGICTDPPKVDGASCDDSDACTTIDECQSGVCTGTTPVVCTALDQCHDVGVCNPGTGICTDPPKVDGASCDDSDACTTVDECQSGVCTGTTPVVCTALDQCHDVGVCNPGTGICTDPPKVDGASCDDSDACTTVDECQSGVCTGTTPVVCTALDQCHDVGVCNPGTGVCTDPPKVDGASCDDSDACTTVDECQSGVCAGTTPVVCTALDQCHDVGVCNPGTGICTDPPKVDGASCDDSDACTTVDECQSGVCTGTTPVVCTALDQCHDVGVCNPGTGICTDPPKVDGASCDDSDACTTVDECQSGVCTGTTPVVCTALDQCHDVGVCNPGTGICTDPPKVDGASCDDSDACTTIDECQSGVCTGTTPVVCTALDQCHDVGVCNPGTGICTDPPKVDGASCDDSDACTTIDECQSGVCTGTTPVVCTALDQCHDVGVCNPGTGICTDPPKVDGASCDDSDACTTVDECQSGVCTGTTPVVCTALDQCHDVGVCNPGTGICTDPPKVDGASCDDSDACTTIDECQSGVCTGTTPVVCTALDQCHNVGVCNPGTGICTDPPKVDGASCDDSDACTTVDECQSGVCTGTTPVVCTALDQCHNVGVCNPGTGICTDPPKVDGASCDDSDACTTIDECQSGVCTGTTPVVCTALDQCHDVGVCNPGTGICTDPPKVDGASCDDSDACTTVDECQSGVCTGTTPVVCTALDQCHDVGVCNPGTGICTDPPKVDGASCDDSDACTTVDECQSGVCAGTTPVVCTALDQCHDVGVCNPGTGICTDPPKVDGASCDDSDACTTVDECQSGVCTGTTPVVCTALDQCHDVGVCNPGTGICTDPPKVDGASCDDSDACTTIDECQSGVCTGTTPVVCTALDQCHDVGVCNPGTGICTDPPKVDGASCDDSDACTTVDECQSGVCTGTTPVVCTALDQCHDVGVCNPGTGICTDPPKVDGASCDDSDACTTIDECQSGVCTGTTPVVCTALDQCHDVGVCNPGTGICTDPPKVDGASCDDSDACTTVDECQSGVCTGTTPVVCTALDQCHNVGVCNPGTGICTDPPKVDGASCDDSDACTTVDECQSGVCTGTTPVVCTALDQCHDVGVCNPGTGICTDPPKVDGASCDDSDACTTVDECQSGVCTGTTPVVCTALDQCHDVGVCNPGTGICTDPPKVDGASCDDSDACTTVDECQSGVCTGTTPVVCTALDQCHDVGVCNPGTGICTDPPKVDGASCDDSDACTTVDECQSGVCTGTTPVVCTALDQCHDVGVCNPGTGICTDPPKVDGASCDDSDACTTIDECQSGVCTGTTPVVCTALDQCHDVGVCNPGTGICTDPPKVDGASCDDSDACTTVDECQSGVCTGTTPVVCTALDQCHDVGVCNPGTGICTDPPKVDGASCDDSDACTTIDECQSGVCTGTTPVVCTALDQCHNVGVCNPGTGICTDPPKVDGASCDDSDACTTVDECQSGVCTGTTPVVCTALDQCHNVGVCNPGTGICTDPPKVDGASCDDSDACTTIDECQSGVCTGTTPVVCTALDQCHDVGVCNPGTGICTDPPKVDGASCDDSDACTTVDECQSGVCTGTTPVVCTALDQCHDVGVCNPGTGICTDPPKVDGASCDDSDACTTVDECQSGVCTGTTPVVCTALDQCHDVGVCNAGTGICTDPPKVDGASCDDSDACTTIDECQSGVCTGTTPVVCTALDQCHNVGVCNPGTGICTDPPKVDGASCDDSDACTTVDECQSGVCTGTTPVVCTALDQCHDVGVCNPGTGICTDPPKVDGASCDDSDACTTIDECQSGVCTGTTPVVCTALDQCHDVGVCNPGTGICTDPPKVDGASCDDSDACTTVDECQSGVCTGTTPVVCTALDQCHDVGVCNPGTGICTDPPKVDGASCDDSDACTTVDECQSGVCTGTTPVVCTALDQCHDVGVCNPGTGICTDPPKVDGASCDDSDACTTVDECQSGVCTGTTPVVCTALDQCHDVGVCNPGTGICTDPPKVDGASCDDSDACTTVDECQSGVCTGTTPVVCTALDQCHNVGVCNPGTGICTDPPKVDGASCDDSDACTTIDECQSGVCTGTTPVVCTALDQCHDVGVCNPGTGICTDPPKVDGASCDDSDACTTVDECQSGVCTGTTPVVCTALDQCHDVGVCNPGTGICTDPPKVDGASCDDSDACTTVDECQSGVCTGTTPVVCTALDQCHDVGVCNPGTGICTDPPKVDGASCDDSDACTTVDECQSGVCAGTTPVVCTALDQCHDVGVCNPGTGICTDPPKVDGASCDDSDACTTVDECQSGVCTGTTPVVCTALDQCHDVGVCNPGTGICTDPPKVDGASCDDSDACTTIDECQSGVCTGTTPVVCTALDQCHNVGVCNPGTGICTDPPKVDGASCDDSDACTTVDECQSGVCTGTTPVVCTALDQCHNVGVCNPGTGICTDPPKVDGASCDDSDACTTIDECQSGVCTGTTPVVCTALDQCHDVGVCNPGTGICTDPPKVDGASCDDSDACTTVDECQSGVCTGTTPVVCTALDQCHDVGVCNPGTGICTDPPKVDGASCDDSDACTTIDECQSGVCTGTTPVVCTALDQCHDVGVCNPGTGICTDPPKVDGASCDDSDACTTVDECQSGVCTGTTPVVCTALDQCHDVGVCNPGTGICTDPPKVDGASCDDSDACTTVDECQSGVCTGTTPVVCTALDQCHDVGVCNPGTGICTDPPKVDGASCDDSDACTTIDECQSGVCTGTTPVVCTALDQCHNVGVCNPGTGICTDPPKVDGASCDDSDACTTVDECQSGVCAGTTPVVCTALDQCHDVGVCNPGTGICTDPPKVDGASCDDSDACTTVDECQSGVCTGTTPVVCTALDQCHDVGVCNPGTGVCTDPPKVDGASCDDSDACTTIDECQSGVCTGTTPVVCTALDQCHDVGVCNPGTGICTDPPKVDGASCDDSDACTTIDECQSGVCTGTTPVVCTALDQCHDVGVCNPGTGICTDPPKVDGASCDDSDACTTIDECQSGVCTGTTPVVCTALDQCHNVGVCNPGTGICTDPPKVDGASCDDSDACTTVDECQSGVCTGTTPVVCTALDQCHNVGVCNPGTGICTDPPKVDGASCDDSDACTTIDECQSGVCTGTTPVVCTALDQCHNVGVCNPGTGICTDPPKVDGASCDDSDACTTVDECQSGVCAGTTPVVCTALDQCHDVGVCNPGTGICTDPPKVDGASCDDSDACTTVDECQSGVCTGTTPVVCTALDQCHDVGVCNPGTGICTDPPKVDGASCDDSDACTTVDECQSGVCTGTTPVVCTALDQCHDVGVCNPGTGICTDPPKVDGASCDDSDACTTVDECQSGVCTGTTPVVCTALDQCHDVGVCNPGTGICTDPPKVDGASCDDSDACTTVDECQSGVCTGTTPVVCTALDQCHDVGVCNPGTGICTDPPKVDGASCDDSDACTTVDECQSGVCTGTTPVVCTALDQCHDVGVCNPGTGICTDPPKVDGASCDDSDACTTVDECQSGVCTGTTPVVCTALDQCHDVGVCNPGTGICTDPPKVDGASCDDSDACTTVDECQSGVCTGTTPPLISDDFSVSGTPPSGWTEINGSWATSGTTLSLDDTTNNSLIYHSGETTCALDQWVRVEYTDVGTTNGAVLRQSTSTTAVRYVVTYDESSENVVWSYCTGSTPSCTSIETFASSFSLVDTDSLGFQVSGTGGSTAIKVWKNPSGADPSAWGSADWTSSNDPGAGNYADTGQNVGLFIGVGTEPADFDNFEAGSP